MSQDGGRLGGTVLSTESEVLLVGKGTGGKCTCSDIKGYSYIVNNAGE